MASIYDTWDFGYDPTIPSPTSANLQAGPGYLYLRKQGDDEWIERWRSIIDCSATAPG